MVLKKTVLKDEHFCPRLLKSISTIAIRNTMPHAIVMIISPLSGKKYSFIPVLLVLLRSSPISSANMPIPIPMRAQAMNNLFLL